MKRIETRCHIKNKYVLIKEPEVPETNLIKIKLI